MLLIPASLGLRAEPISLFNGKDLTGWTGADYEVKDGVLICSGKILRTEKQYSNYVFEFDFLLPKGGNNGIGIHYPGEGRPSGAGMELQILDNSHPKYSKLKESQYHGSLYKLQQQSVVSEATRRVESSEGHGRWPEGHRGIERYKDSGCGPE